MIDIQLLRKDPEGVARRLAARGPGAFDAELFQRYETARKDLQTALEQAQASKNKIAKDIGAAKGRGQDVAPLLEQGEKLKELLERSEQHFGKLQAEIQDFEVYGWSHGILAHSGYRACRLRTWTHRPCTPADAQPYLSPTAGSSNHVAATDR